MTTATVDRQHTTDRTLTFPGPWLAGVSLIVGPLLLLTGTLLRLGVPFFFPHQLAAYERQPTLVGTAYALFLAGTIALWPGIVAVAARVGVTRPAWAMWGGSLVIFGLFGRAFHYGVNAFAFSLVDSTGLSTASQAVSAYYSYPEWVASSLAMAIVLGWVVLATGCFLSRTLRLLPAVALASMSGLMVGVLKGSTWASAVQVAGLTVALVPLGVTYLRGADRPSRRTALQPALLLLLLLVGSVVLGQLG